MRALSALAALLLTLAAARLDAQGRLAVLQADDRRAGTAQDLAIIRAGLRSVDPETARVAVLALGRLERPALIPDIVGMLRHPLPEIRAEAANAVGQAASTWKAGGRGGSSNTLDSVAATLNARLVSENAASVRAALCETLGRLPYATADQVGRAEAALVGAVGPRISVDDKLGIAKGLFWLQRLSSKIRPLSEPALAVLRGLAAREGLETIGGPRVRRVALDTLVRADAADEAVVGRAATDPDFQVRRLGMRAAIKESQSDAVLLAGLRDSTAMVRIEALRSLGARKSNALCQAAIVSAADPAVAVALVAIDQMRACTASPDAVALLDRLATDVSNVAAPRSWHRPAHALVALAAAAPERGSAALPAAAKSTVWQLRVYAAAAAGILKNRTVLDTLAVDPDDNVREAAIDGLVQDAGHEADATYIAELGRPGYQVVRAAAVALEGTEQISAAVPALKAAWGRLASEGRDNSHDAREAIAATLVKLRAAPPAVPPRKPIVSKLTAPDLRRLAAAQARVSIRGVGQFTLALITSQAPLSVLRFVQLVESGYYNGLTFHRVEPNFVIQGGSPGANEYIGDAAFMRDELGLWPHVRGAVGISTRGRDTGDAQFFIDLVDLPSLDHEYTVFGQVLNGLDVVDAILEGDVIEKIEIIKGA